ncbi:MAG TPA: exonuclease subunit SbcD [Bacteroidetes bacterium]|nr:exonuclease subunit SbcD [Bacteroidota bacterium]
MKILHTSDWHLGQKFISREREEEHALALDWLANIIIEKKVDLLIVAGDVFDIGNPPSSSRAMYYNFLKRLWQSDCRHVIITGGNHDSPQMLDAPRDILQILDVHIIGKATDDPADEIIVLKNKKGNIEAVVAAVPFLRDQDLRRAVSGETSKDRVEKIREGILVHYEAVGKEAQKYKNEKVPMIVTGHLCVTGHEASHKQDNIYLGSIENIKADQFPKIFDYVALGHIHRPQSIGGKKEVRYSGSLIPLSFSETKDTKSVTLIDFNKNKIRKIEELELPIFRRLKTIEGSFEYVQERLEKLHHDYKDGLSVWVEVVVESDTLIPNLNGLLQDFIKNLNIEILKTRLKTSHFSISEQGEYQELEELDPIDVFTKKCESAGRAPDDIKELTATFKELEQWHRERS